MTESTDTLIPTLVDHLNAVDYSNLVNYVPSKFAIELVNLIKLINGGDTEDVTPVVHYYVLDKMFVNDRNVINICHRGMAKTTLKRYLLWYIALYGELPGLKSIVFALYITDTIDNGVKTMKRNLVFEHENSEFLQSYIPKVKFTEQIWEFENIDGRQFTCQGYGAQALSLDSKLICDDRVITMGECSVGDEIVGADGKLTTVIAKSEVFNKPMYKITLKDGRTIKVSEDHINTVVLKQNYNDTAKYIEKNLTTRELLDLPLEHTRKRIRKDKSDYFSNENLLFIRNCSPVEFSEKELEIDPYILGLLLGDGSFKKDGSVVLHAHKDDMDFYITQLEDFTLGTRYRDKRNNTVDSLTIKNLSQVARDLDLVRHGDHKKIPRTYFFGSIEQRLALLRGLLDSDGCVYGNSRVFFSSNSYDLIYGVKCLVWSLGGTVSTQKHPKRHSHYKVNIWLSLNPFLLPRKRDRFKPSSKDKVAIVAIDPYEDAPSQCIAVDNRSKQYLTNGFTRTHNTGVRGTTVNNERPRLALMDDLMSDKVAESPACIENIENTIYRAVRQALNPTHRKIVWSGTPFNAKDPLHKAVESGAWEVNAFPVCEEFPCEETDFRGSWPERFTYAFVKKEYDELKSLGKLADFNQELMLRIMSDEDRLIDDADINWYSRNSVIKHRNQFNFYITTDFATSEKAASDFSVISVWAYSNKGYWFWVDGICKKQDMGKNINDLFRLCQKWIPQSVGIEVSGQQGGFIPWIQDQMIVRNNFFNIASENNDKKPGIRPNTNKLVRFNIVVPWFKSGIMFFPKELKNSKPMLECMDELTLVSKKGFKSKHDDFIDTISMLSLLPTWKPSEVAPLSHNEDTELWEIEEEEDSITDLNSYIV